MKWINEVYKLEKRNRFRSIFLYGLPLILLSVLFFVFDFNGLYGQDSHAYYKYAKELFLFFNKGIQPNYFYWPKVYPFIGAVLGFSGISVLLLMQFISFLSLIGALYLSNQLIYQIYAKDGKEWLLLGGVLATYFIRGGVLVMSDMLAAYFIIACFYNFVLFFKNKKSINLISMLCFVGLASFVRYASFPLFVVPLCIVFYSLLKKSEILNRLVLILIVLVTIYFVFIYKTVLVSLMNEFFLRWKFEYIYSRSFENKDGYIHHLVPNFLYVFGNFFHIGYLSFGVLLIPFFRKSNYLNTVLLSAILFYLVFLAGFSTQNYRFLLISHLLVLIFLFPTYQRLRIWLINNHFFKVFIICLVIFNSFFFIYSFRKTYIVHENEKVIARELYKIARNEIIYSFYVDQSFPSYGITNKVKNLYMEDLQNFKVGSLVVFNENKFERQWKNTLVIKNWNKLVFKYELEELKVFKNNWKIYRVKKSIIPLKNKK